MFKALARLREAVATITNTMEEREVLRWLRTNAYIFYDDFDDDKNIQNLWKDSNLIRETMDFTAHVLETGKNKFHQYADILNRKDKEHLALEYKRLGKYAQYIASHGITMKRAEKYRIRVEIFYKSIDLFLYIAMSNQSVRNEGIPRPVGNNPEPILSEEPEEDIEDSISESFEQVESSSLRDSPSIPSVSIHPPGLALPFPSRGLSTQRSHSSARST